MHFLFLIFFLSLPVHAAEVPQLVTKKEAAKLAEVFQMPGLDRFISDQAKQVLIQEVGNKMAEWAAEGLHQIIKGPRTKDQGLGTTGLKQVFAKNPELSKQLKQEIQNKLEAWLPKLAKKVLSENLGEFKEIEEEVNKVLNTTFKEEADQWIGGWYSQMMEEGSIRPLQIGRFLSNQIGDAIGSATVKGIQNNILKGLNGELPEEALKYLKMGPEKFQEYAEKYKQYLPSAQFAKLKDKVMGIHVVDLPNQVYGGILATSAAMHFAKAFAGMKINFYELKRAKEVTETLVWQLRNKESVSLSLGDFVGMVKMLGDQLGQFHWGTLKKVAKWNPANQFMEKLNWFEDQLKKIDQLYDKATGKVLEGFDKALGEIEGELKKFSDEMLAPLKIPLHNCIVAEGCTDVLTQLPGWMNKTPLDYLKDFYEDSGLKKDLEETNRKVASALATAAVAVTDALHITGPLAEILDVEKIPQKNPSQDSDFDPIFLHNGEFYYMVTDVTVPGKGLPFQFTRIYRSASNFLGVLGYNWTHNFAEKLVPWDPSTTLRTEGPGFTYVDPEGKKYFFKKEELHETPNGFSMQFEDGSQHLFNKDGVLQAIRDDEGNQFACFYNELQQLIKVEDTQGRPFQFFYRPDGLMERLEDFTGRIWRFDYNKDAELIAATSPGTPSFPKGKTTGYRYLNHKMTLIMDPKGQVYLQNFYGRDGKVMAQKYGDETASIEARYDGLNTWVKDRRGVMHLYEHDEEGRLLQRSILKQDGTLKKVPGSLWGRGPKGAWHLPHASLNKESAPIYEYDLWGNIISITDSQGNVRKFEIDASNLITKEFNNGEERRYFYDANDNIIRMEVPSRNLKVEFEYDVLDRMIAKKEFLSPDHVITTRYEYDPQGRLTRFAYPMGNDIRFIYDDEGNLIQKVPGTFGSKGARHLLKQSGAAYDPIGRPLVINNIQFEWDDNSRLSSITDEKGEKTVYAYDNLNRLILEKFPNGSQTAYTYDQEDHLVKIIDRQGNTHQFKYDSEGRLEQRLAGPYEQHFSYDKSGRLMEALDFNDPNSKSDDVRTQFAYDASYRLVGESMNGRWVYKSYDAKNQKTGIKYPSKLQVVRQFDETGNLTQVFAKDQPVATFKYSKEGLLTEQEWGNSVQLSQGFDNFQRLVSQTFGSVDKTPSLGWKYFYDGDGRLEKLEEIPSNLTKTYLYDKKGKLIEGPPQEKNNKEFLYDYDPFGRLIAVRDLNNKVVVQYVYDAFGRVARKTFPSQEKIIDSVYDDWHEIEAYSEGKLSRAIIYGETMDQPLALKTDGIYFYHTDRLGSVRFLTDKSGQLVESYDYTPFGERIGESQVGNDLGFIGRPFEKETGLINLRHRYYSPASREFITPDPLGYKNDFYTSSNVFTPRNFSYHQGQGGASRTTMPNYVEQNGEVSLLDIDLFFARQLPQLPTPEMDLYAYAGGDPINFFDPLGLYKIDIQLPFYGQRDHYGILKLYLNEGRLMTGPFKVLGRSSNDKAKKENNPTRNPLKKYGDTPTGQYEAGPLKWKKDIEKYGPHRVIPMIPISGDALIAQNNGRKGLLIHGGRKKEKTDFGDNLVPTHGCIRMHDEDLAILISEINRLKEEENDTKGTIDIRESSLSDTHFR